MKTRIFYAAMMMAMVSVVSCTEEIVSPQQSASPELQESAVTVHAVMDEGMTKVTLGDDSGETTPVYWDTDDKIGITIDETTYSFERTDDAVESKTATFEYGEGEPELPTLTEGEYTFTYPANGKATLASQAGTKEGLKAYHYMEATFTAEEEQDWNNLPGLSFETKVAIVKLTLKNDAFKGKEVTGVTLISAEDAYAATSVFTGSDADGSIVAYFAVEPGSLTGCVIGATCEDDYYEASLSNNTLSAGRLYRVNKTMAKAHIDLSPVVAGVNRTANSYIVSKAGDYKFKATHKGNSSTEAIGAITSAAVLWESFGTATAPQKGDLVKADVEYRDGYVYFSTADTYKEGNAVIAVIDDKNTDDTEDDVILWSWHIWLTDQPAEHEYANDAGTMMDRNLGATSATPGDVGALGLLYQWGRKDPFLGSSAISGYEVAKSTITWPGKVESSAETGTIAYAVTHPTTFISNADEDSNRDWYYTGNNTTDNTRWTEAKSVYDPCPAGWRVPDGGTDGIWNTAGFGDPTFDETNKGKTFSNNGIEIWYPAAGYLAYDKTLSNAGKSLYCWTATPWPDSASAINLYFKSGSPGSQNLATNHGMRAIGCSVRCCKE